MSAPVLGAIMAERSASAQALLAQIVARWGGPLRIAGVIEEPPASGEDCSPGTLVSIHDGARFPLGQDLGCEAQGCTLDSGALVSAAAWVETRLSQPCDLLILSKFGKMEAEAGSGLLSCLLIALDRAVPVLLTISPRFVEAWAEFAGPYAQTLPPDMAAVESWLEQITAPASLPPQ
ncbi:DUF2478 domain-containing protein [Novosphingobium sediminicola]|nr:DUF2478 domain-containing protein [Novosphingobium sediminicola]